MQSQANHFLGSVMGPVTDDWSTANCPTVLTDEVPLVVSRQIMLGFAQDIFKLPAEVYKPVASQ